MFPAVETVATSPVGPPAVPPTIPGAVATAPTTVCGSTFLGGKAGSERWGMVVGMPIGCTRRVIPPAAETATTLRAGEVVVAVKLAPAAAAVELLGVSGCPSGTRFAACC